MSEETGAIGANDCFVTDNVMSSSRNLIDGAPLNPINFADLCELIEMAVMHERIIMTIPAFDGSSLKLMVKDGIVTSSMFKDATPPGQEDQQLVSNIYKRCLEAMDNGGIFGRGIMNMPKSHEDGLGRALDRIKIGDFLLSVEFGRREVDPDAVETLSELRRFYGVFEAYADAVFEAAQHFHVSAYAGTSEIPYAIQKTAKSVPLALYEELRKLYKDRVDRFLVSAGFTTYDIPPFALIVLSRCKSREDIVPEILRARDEFSTFRDTCTDYATRTREAVGDGSLKDIIDLQNDLDRAIEVLRKKAKASSKDSRFVYRLWDVVKAASPIGITKNVVDTLKTYDIERQHLKTVNGLMDIWKKLGRASSYEACLRSDLFPNEFSQEDFKIFYGYLKHVREYLPVGADS